jgi:hypothetical protein
VKSWLDRSVTGTGRGAWILSPETYKDLDAAGKMYTLVGGPGVTRPEDGNVVRVVFVETSSRAAAKTLLTLMRNSITDSEAKWVVGSSGNLLFVFRLDKNLGDNHVPGYTQSSNVNSIYYKLP